MRRSHRLLLWLTLALLVLLGIASIGARHFLKHEDPVNSGSIGTCSTGKIPTGSQVGLSGLAGLPDRRGAYAVAERGGLLRYEVDNDTWCLRDLLPHAQVQLETEADLESIAVAPDHTLYLGTETHSESAAQDEIFVARWVGDDLRKIETIKFSYHFWPGVENVENRGIEGLCYVDGYLLTAAERVWMHEGKRHAPLALYSLNDKSWHPYSLELQSNDGRISAIDCALQADGRIRFWAIERHRGHATVQRGVLTITTPPAFPQILRPTSSISLDGCIDSEGALNFEGLWVQNSGENFSILNDNHYGAITTATRISEYPGCASYRAGERMLDTK